MKTKRESSCNAPPSKRIKTAPKPVDVDEAAVPSDLEQYIGTFDDIVYDQARRWCKYFGRKGRGGNLETLKQWLKDKYDRHGKGPLDKPNDLPPTPEYKRGSPREEKPESKRGSPKGKSPESSRLNSRRTKTPDIKSKAAPEELPTQEPSADEDAKERIASAWRLLRIAADMLEREHEHNGVGKAADQLKNVLYMTLADYDPTRATRRPKLERQREAQEPPNIEATVSGLRENHGRQSPGVGGHAVVKDKDPFGLDFGGDDFHDKIFKWLMKKAPAELRVPTPSPKTRYRPVQIEDGDEEY